VNDATFTTRIDPLDFEVIRCRLRSISEQMTATMERTARSPIYFAARDFSVGLFDARGNTVTIYEGIPLHVYGMPFSVRAILDAFGDDIRPGDQFLTNDPYSGGSSGHLPDFNIFTPVFRGRELLFWAGNRAHQQDIGGSVEGGYNPAATDIYAEGVRYPPVRIIEDDRIKKDIFNVILANMRYPDTQKGDLLAMIGANRLGARALGSLIDRYGPATIKAYFEDLFDYTERLIRLEIARLPDGVYRGECTGEGGPRCPTFTVRATVTIAGSDITIDFSESDPQVPSYINSPLTNTVGSTWIALLTTFGKRIKHISQGLERAVTIVTRPGTITDPVLPAPVSSATNFCAKQIINCVWDAFAKVVPELTPSGWGAIPFEVITGIDPREGRPYATIDFLNAASGTGAIWGTDGWATGTPEVCSGCIRYPDVEHFEVLTPNRWDTWEIEPDSGAPGRWRGGTAMRTVVSNLGGAGAIHSGGQGFSEAARPVPSIAGGRQPAPARRWIAEPDGSTTAAGELTSYAWRPGATMTVVTQGGCGVGDPFEREVAAVRKDVIEEKVSIEGARRDYGVSIDPETFAVDEAETRRLRGAARG
jgi:N-methylhydantoinase B